MERICALIEFTPRGYVEHYLPDAGSGISSSRLEGYEAPEEWKPDEGAQYPDSLPVLDKRAPLMGGLNVLLKAPVLRLYDPFEDDEGVKALIERLSSKSWNLRKCGLEEHIAYWRRNGARTGHIMRGQIVWDIQEEQAAS